MILKYLEKVDQEPEEKKIEELKVMNNLALTFSDDVSLKSNNHLHKFVIPMTS